MSEWIPCSERLPEITHFMYDVHPFSDNVLVFVRNEYGAERMVIGCVESEYEYHRWHSWSLTLHPCDEKFSWIPVAWMPLPEPYKEESDA